MSQSVHKNVVQRMVNLSKKQIELLFIALSFYSRLPVPSGLDYSPIKLKRCGVYFPFVGLLLATLCIGSLYLFLLIFSDEIAVALSIALLVWLTGSFHEDGFADFCDGFGGGYQKEQILTIMVDSRIGTYGAVGLLLNLLLRYLALVNIVQTHRFIDLSIYLLVAFSFSRFMAYSYTFDHEYVRISSQDTVTKNKSAFMKQKANKLKDFVHAAVLGMAPLLLLPWPQALTIIGILMLIRFVFGRYLVSKIGGYTGDCLGAAQQIFEVSIYLILGTQLWNYM